MGNIRNLIGFQLSSEHELAFAFAICCRKSVCLSVVCRL